MTASVARLQCGALTDPLQVRVPSLTFARRSYAG